MNYKAKNDITNRFKVTLLNGKEPDGELLVIRVTNLTAPVIDKYADIVSKYDMLLANNIVAVNETKHPDFKRKSKNITKGLQYWKGKLDTLVEICRTFPELENKCSDALIEARNQITKLRRLE